MIQRRISWLLDRLPAGPLRRRVSSSAAVAGEVDLAVWDVSTLREEIPDWDDLDQTEKVARLQDLDVEPEQRGHSRNTVNDDWHEHVVDILDRGQNPDAVEASHFAVGTDNTAPTSGDDGLGGEVYRSSVATTSDDGRDLTVTCFLDSTEANGHSLVEMGLFTGPQSSGELQLNHALIDAINKTDGKVATLIVTLQFRSV
ncbi:hypothetical protein [Halosimplex sp. J119]